MWRHVTKQCSKGERCFAEHQCKPQIGKEKMLGWLKQQSATARRAGELYGRVVASARQPEFYRDLGVPDTPEGRFELVALHLFVALERVKQHPDGNAIAQRAIERFIADMDDCLREMGVGDMAVPKKVKRAAGGFYERAGAYRDGLQKTNDAVLCDAVSKYVFNGVTPLEGAPSTVAQYIRQRVLASLHETVDEILSSDVAILPDRASRPEDGPSAVS